ncbi:hypothetical protein AXF42_Ash014373 [Apostasia shenzhenica]|uniref:Uncharacterized protein n=1 Tax=Apostasia shenzhenica TaxID=1088818 RepID=A0A2I0B0Y5_9ASPA|nr:hypothetical protein AXF42_Ash014373 [Apostasia shenzhenica]
MAQTLCLSQFALANEACGFVGPHTASNVKAHDHHRHHHKNPEGSACCRRLAGIEDACICQMMSKMPAFITKPKHTVTIVPTEGCEVTYECGIGRFPARRFREYRSRHPALRSLESMIVRPSTSKTTD